MEEAVEAEEEAAMALVPAVEAAEVEGVEEAAYKEEAVAA
jgi:hypothetical protein